MLLLFLGMMLLFNMMLFVVVWNDGWCGGLLLALIQHEYRSTGCFRVMMLLLFVLMEGVVVTMLYYCLSFNTKNSDQH